MLINKTQMCYMK